MSNKRSYKKRTASTKAKSYEEYLEARKVLEDKGIRLKDVLTRRAYEEVYKTLSIAKREKEISSQPFQELMRRQRYLTPKQARVMAKAYSDMTGSKFTYKDAVGFDPKTVGEIGRYMNSLSDDKRSLYGGNYE